MESFDYWRLCDNLSILQAALLIVGEDPSSNHIYLENWKIDERPLGYEAAKTALINAVLGGSIQARIIPIYEHDINGNICGEVPESVDINETKLLVHDIKQFLKTRGFNAGFFFPAGGETSPDYLSKNCPFYAPKLAAAMEVWKAVSNNPLLRKGTTPKQAMMKWLRENANQFGLTKDDGHPNDQGIEEISKIANWDTKGGAPKTPGSE